MLPIIVQHLPRDRDRMGMRPVQMAGRLELTLAEYRWQTILNPPHR